MSWARDFMSLVLEKLGNPYRDPSTGKYTSGPKGGGGPAAPPVARSSVILGTKLAGPGGSNPGGIYRGTDGTERYVKFYSDPREARVDQFFHDVITRVNQAILSGDPDNSLSADLDLLKYELLDDL